MCVYCDIAAYTIIGYTKAPLLRVRHVTANTLTTYEYHMIEPHYVTLSCRDFDTIEININTERVRLMPFEFRKSVVTLQLRRKHEKKPIVVTPTVNCTNSTMTSNSAATAIFQFMSVLTNSVDTVLETYCATYGDVFCRHKEKHNNCKIWFLENIKKR